MKRSQGRRGEPFLSQERGELSLHFAAGTVQSRMSVNAPERLVLDYTRSMMACLLLNPQPRHIVMLGLGGGSLVKYCHAHLPATRFTALEISPEVISMRSMFAIPPDDDRLSVILADGAQWLREHPGCCDVLMLDGFDAGGLPPALYSQAFFDDCAAALEPGGVLVSNVWAKPSVRERVIERLCRSFDSGVLTLLAEDRENTIALARRDAPMPEPEVLRERARQLAPAHPVELETSAEDLARALAESAEKSTAV